MLQALPFAAAIISYLMRLLSPTMRNCELIIAAVKSYRINTAYITRGFPQFILGVQISELRHSIDGVDRGKRCRVRALAPYPAPR